MVDGVKVKINANFDGLKKVQKSLKKSKSLKIGFFGGGESVQKAFFTDQGTRNIPPRPFLSDLPDYIEKKDILAFMKHSVGGNKNPMDSAKILEEKVRQRILNNSYADNAPSTIKRKGFNRPLVETMQMSKDVEGKYE